MSDIDLSNNDMFSFLKQNYLENYEENAEAVEENNEEKDLICSDGSVCELVSSKGIVLCSKCGKMSEKIIEYSAEWRYYGSEDSKSSDPTRCGLPANFLLKGSSLGSIISNSGLLV